MSGAPLAPQPYAQLEVTAALPSAAHVESVVVVGHVVLFGTHTLHAAVPPVRAPQPFGHVVGVAAVPSAAHVESVVAFVHEVELGAHTLQRAPVPLATQPLTHVV